MTAPSRKKPDVADIEEDDMSPRESAGGPSERLSPEPVRSSAAAPTGAPGSGARSDDAGDAGTPLADVGQQFDTDALVKVFTGLGIVVSSPRPARPWDGSGWRSLGKER